MSGQNQYRNESDCQYGYNNTGRGIVESEQREDGFCDLNQRPRGYYVGRSHAKNVTPLQFIE